MITRGSPVRSYHPTVPDHLMYEGVVTLGPDSRGFAVIACEVGGLPVWRLVHWDSLRENVECRTCGGSGEVARTVALPGHALATTVTRYDACPDCTPENVETSNG